MKYLPLGVIVLLLPVAIALGQAMARASLDEQLHYLFPEAERFSDKEGSPPHYKAFGPVADGGPPELLGLAFWTTELDPLERGFDGPIKMLVGMDVTGKLTRIIVTDG